MIQGRHFNIYYIQTDVAAWRFGVIDMNGTYFLADVISRLEELPDEQIIYAERINGEWLPRSRASLITQQFVDGKLAFGKSVNGLQYFLEVAIAREVIECWAAFLRKTEINKSERFRVLSYYADKDAYPPS